MEEIEASDIFTRLGLEKGKYILLATHREENIDTEKNFTSELLNCLKKYQNKEIIMLSSSIQVTLAGRFGDFEYGRSKLAGESI